VILLNTICLYTKILYHYLIWRLISDSIPIDLIDFMLHLVMLIF